MKQFRHFGLMIVTLGLFVFGACDKIEEASIIDVTIPDFTFEIQTDLTAPAESTLKSSMEDGFKEFSGTSTLSLSDSSLVTLAEYKSMIQSFSLENISVLGECKSGTVAKNIVISVEGISVPYRLENYQLNKDYSADPALVNFAIQILNKLIRDESVTVTITGSTDIDDGDQLTFNLGFKGLQVKAQLVKL